MFTNEEKSAVVQCFWQLLSARPTKEENEFISQLTSTWKLSGGWVLTAIKKEPYSAFKKVSEMSIEKKNEFKRLVSLIVFVGGNFEYNSRMTTSLFLKTLI